MKAAGTLRGLFGDFAGTETLRTLRKNSHSGAGTLRRGLSGLSGNSMESFQELSGDSPAGIVRTLSGNSPGLSGDFPRTLRDCAGTVRGICGNFTVLLLSENLPVFISETLRYGACRKNIGNSLGTFRLLPKIH